MDKALMAIAKEILENTKEQKRHIEAGDAELLNRTLDRRLMLLKELQARQSKRPLPPDVAGVIREARELSEQNLSGIRAAQDAAAIEFARAKQTLRTVGAYEGEPEERFSRGIMFDTRA